MKKIYEKWWAKGTKVVSIINYKQSWKEVGNKPRISFHENGGRRKNKDRCFDANLIVGYTVFSYTNFALTEEDA